MNLALLGKGIQHSLSPNLYRKLLGESVNYKLLDFEEFEIPSLEYIFKNNELDGLNITSPYEKFFIQDVTIPRDFVQRIGGINCIKQSNGRFYGENTDELAFKQLFDKHLKEYNFKKIVLLGDGTMANMIKLVLESYDINVVQRSRRVDQNIAKLDIDHSEYLNTAIINACSRSYTYDGPLSSDILFWDMNYKMDKHKFKIPNYIDGEELLELQARLAIDFFKVD